jgi:hypothetical protein
MVVLRRVFGLKREEVTGEPRQLRNEDFHDLYFSQTVFWLLNQGDVRHVWRRREMLKGFWSVNIRERDYIEDLGIDGMIIVKGKVKVALRGLYSTAA